jgi:ATP-dependent helicase YprA (DUF1998 family)
MPTSKANIVPSTTKVPHYVLKAAIHKGTHEKLLKHKHQPRDFQMTSSVHIAGGKDAILVAPTGSGKTLVLAMPFKDHHC